MTKPNTKLLKDNYSADIAIVGGGLAGMGAALALSQIGLKIIVFENTNNNQDNHPNYDDRTLVVNKASIHFWKNINIWHRLIDDITPIKKVHVSNKGHFGTVQFNASEFNCDALAYIVEAKILARILHQAIAEERNINLISPAYYINHVNNNDSVTINYKQKDKTHQLECNLLLAADGIQSNIRKALKLKTEVKPYNSTAIICNITPQLKHHYCAYERFGKSGPTALLPFVDNRCGFVWTVANDKCDQLLELSDHKFIRKAQSQFGYRLGRFIKVGKRSSYPLYYVKVPKQVKSRVILIGNAAHGMSPVSAQGLNLSIRDIANLVDVLSEAIKKQHDLGSDLTLQKYQNKIQSDQDSTMQYTDDLMGWFKIDSTLVSSVRSLAILALNQSTAMKQTLFQRASGFRSDTPSLLKIKEKSNEKI